MIGFRKGNTGFNMGRMPLFIYNYLRQMKQIFIYIKAAKFFPKYAPMVIDWKKKLSGKNGRGNPLDFSEADKITILTGLHKMHHDLTQKSRN